MARHLRQLVLTKELQQGGKGHAAASALGVRSFVADKLVAQARLYELDELGAALAAVSRADVRLKSSRLDAALVLDQLLIHVMTRS